MLTLQYLRALEDLLRKRYQRNDFVLSDYFDLIGGTSTGAIIAGALALGMTVDKVEGHYNELASRIFRKPWFRLGALSPKFGREELVAALQRVYGSATTMGSQDLRTGLLIVSKRMDSGSAWVLTNHPNDPYYNPQSGKKRIGNANMLLWQVVRASTAAPHFFKPEELTIGSWIDPTTSRLVEATGEFVDGGVSPGNNPALQCLRAALITRFGFRWQPGAENLLLVSVGTGLRRRGSGKARGWRALAGVYAVNALRSLMDDCNTEVELSMQWLSASPTARRIDSLVEDLNGDVLGGKPLLHYLRYNVLFDKSQRGSVAVPPYIAKLDQAALDDLSSMDNPGNMRALSEIGRSAAADVTPTHFPACFD